MKLVSVHSRSVVEVGAAALPPYAVLSHTHDSVGPGESHNGPLADPGTHEFLYTFPGDPRPTPYLNTFSTNLPNTVDRACELARLNGVGYIWIEELCIDKASTADLDDAVNGSRPRLRNSEVCFAYLHDLPPGVPLSDSGLWSRCRYWKKAWTLQELVLPRRVLFFDGAWNFKGTKSSSELLPLLSSITAIPPSVLLDRRTLDTIALAVRISWSAGRLARREEDTAYSLVSITGTKLPVRYGEGAERAFLRLQEELLRDTRDSSLLAWRTTKNNDVRGLLARSPSEFSHFKPSAGPELQGPWRFEGNMRFGSKGIELESHVGKKRGLILVPLGRKRQDSGKGTAICFREWEGIYVRVALALQVSAAMMRSWRAIDVALDVKDSATRPFRTFPRSLQYHLGTERRGVHGTPWQQGQQTHGAQQQRSAVLGKRMDEDTGIKMSGEPTLSPWPQRDSSLYNSLGGSVTSVGSWANLEHHRQSSQEDSRNHPHERYAMTLAQEDFSSNGEITSDDDSDTMASHTFSAVLSARSSVLDFDGSSDAEDDTEDISTESRSHTTIAAGVEDANSLSHIRREEDFIKLVLAEAVRAFRAWVPTARYIALPGGLLPPESRINKDRWFIHQESLQTIELGTKTTGVQAFRPDGFFHLACPFYAADSEMHRGCVTSGSDLQSIEDVLDHIEKEHPWMPYCPRCLTNFTDREECGGHVALGTCERVYQDPSMRRDTRRNGVRPDEMSVLRQADFESLGECEAKRWRLTFDGLFEGLDSEGHSPYLDAMPGLAVSMMHDFCTENEEIIVKETLKSRGREMEDFGVDALSQLYRAVRQRLAATIYHEAHLIRPEH